MTFPFLLLWTLLGLCVGSFCNVLIYRMPRGEEFVRTPSHCMTCGHRLSWYELVPVVSWVLQRGKCRVCGSPISRQYPVVELLNAAVWFLTVRLFSGDTLHIVLYSALFSLLLVLAVIDWRTYEIPNGLNLAILLLGVVQLVADRGNWPLYVIGLLCISVPFLLLWFITHGNGLGMGDVKLMGAAGLMLGWPRILLSTILGSVAGSVIHIIRMRHGADRKLAFGPYLAAGIWVSALFGERLITAYLGLFGL